MKDKTNTIQVAIAGCGVVGGATASILTGNSEILSTRTNIKLQLKYIVDVDFTFARECSLDESLFCDDIDTVLSDKSVGILVELIGGIDTAKDIIIRALRAGKHVVTANKALLAACGPELFSIAAENDVSIAFEASCGGGIPVIRSIVDGLAANRLDALFGIVNGTCNYILTEMAEKNISYATALKQAQESGLAEADPTLDVSGHDSAHKLTIMSSLAFGQQVSLDDIPVSGIQDIDPCDMSIGQSLGYVIKLLAIAERQDNGLALRVRPAFISREHPLAWVSGPFNAISIYGNSTGHTMFYGRGAGGIPTASAVVADICSLGLGNWQRTFDDLVELSTKSVPATLLPVECVTSRYYLRMTCNDCPGVLGKITTILGNKKISISSVLQHEPASKEMAGVPVVITIDKAKEGNVRDAINEIDSLEDVNSQTICIGIVEEYPEDIG